MTRWAMVADLERCVGCQTCTAACRHANATSPAVQWRKVLDIEAGTLSERQPHLRAGRLPALRRSAVHACLSVDRDAAARRRHRHHRLRHLHRLRLLRRRLPLSGALQDHQGGLRLRRGSDAERDRARKSRAPRRGAEMHVLFGPHRFRHRERPGAGRRSARDAGLRQRLHRRRAAFRRSRRCRTATSRGCCASTRASACMQSSVPNRASIISTTRRRAAAAPDIPPAIVG